MPLINQLPNQLGHLTTPNQVSQWSLYKAVSDVDLSGNRVINVGVPTNASDAVTKQYADNLPGLNQDLANVLALSSQLVV